MKLAINIAISLLMLALFTWFVWPDEAQKIQVTSALASMDKKVLWPFVGLMLIMHVARAWRWNNLLAPIGVKLKPGPLMAISSVGFMAILALPARLGEFVRPALIRKQGEVSAAAALGTVAVERIVDGLIVSLFLFGALFAIRGPDSPSWMMPAAWAALGIFSAALVFLIFAMQWPKKTINFAISLSLIKKISPRLEELVREKLMSLISGFFVLKDKSNLFIFVVWSLIYWGANGLSMYVLATAFDLNLSLTGAFATMALVAVGITLPNAPALVGQFHAFTLSGLSLYLASSVVESKGLAFAIVLHASQVIWYMGVGALFLLSPWISVSEVVAARRLSDNS